MSVQPRGPSTIRGALVSVNPSGSGMHSIPFQYNPATLKRNLNPQIVGGEEGDRSASVRFKGAPVQTVSVDVELDATDALEANHPVAVAKGIHPQLASLELLIYPSTSEVRKRVSEAAKGVLEIAPATAPLLLFVWGPNRVLPVQLSSYSISEEAFDAHLNPTRATVSLSMRVLTYSDLSSDQQGFHQFLSYQSNLESAGKTQSISQLSAVTGKMVPGVSK